MHIEHIYSFTPGHLHKNFRRPPPFSLNISKDPPYLGSKFSKTPLIIRGAHLNCEHSLSDFS